MTKQKRSTSHQQRQPSDSWFASLTPTTQDLLSVGLLYVVVLIVFRGVIFQNALFSSEGDTANAHSYKHIGDTIQEREGVDAIWTPYVFSGMPTFGNFSYVPRNVSYAETILKPVLKGLFLYSDASWFVAHYFLGGVFMFFLLRIWKFSYPASLIAALTFMLSPDAISLATAGQGSKLYALSYLPLVFLLTHLLYERRDLLSFGLLSSAIGTILLTTHVQIVYYVFLVVGLYTLYDVLSDLKTNRAMVLKKVVLLAGAIAVGLCIASYLYLSAHEYLQFSNRGGGKEGVVGGLTWDYATNWSIHPLELITLLIPSFFGLVSPYYWGWMPFTSSSIYVGLIPIIFTVLALVYRREKMTVFLSLLTLVIFFISFGKHFAVFYQLLFDYLPYFNKFRSPSTILHLLPFTLGILGAFGYKMIVDTQQDSQAAVKLGRILLGALVVFAGVLILATLAKSTIFESLSKSMLVKDGEIQQYQQQYGQRTPQIINQLKQIRFYGDEHVSGLWGDFVRFSLLAIATLGLLVAFLRGRIKPTMLASGLIMLVAFDLISLDARFINPVPATTIENRFAPDAATSFLKQQPGLFRVFPLGGEQFMDNSIPYQEIQSIGGYSPAKLKIYQTMLDSCLYKGTDPRLPLNMNVVNMLNVRYIITSFRLPPDLFPLVQTDQRGKMVYQNPGVMPRAFFVRNVQLAENDHEVFAAINASSFSAATTAVLEKPLPVQIAPPESTSAEITEYEARSITVKTYASSPALLVLSEIYYPAGWTATIDGSPTEIYETNYILRSVLVPAGNHELVMKFEPSTYALGLATSNVAWGVTTISILAGLWQLPSIRKRLTRSGKEGNQKKGTLSPPAVK